MTDSPNKIEPQDLTLILKEAVKLARANAEINSEISNVSWASDSNTWYVIAATRFTRFNAFCFDATDGQIYTMKGAAPKPATKSTPMMPAPNVKRGKLIADRNILTDADWAMKTALETMGAFIRITGTHTTVETGEAA